LFIAPIVVVPDMNLRDKSEAATSSRTRSPNVRNVYDDDLGLFIISKRCPPLGISFMNRFFKFFGWVLLLRPT
jgi:hypothetical protein